MEVEFTSSARPRHSASRITRRWPGWRRFHATSIVGRVIRIGPSLTTLIAPNSRTGQESDRRPDRTLTGRLVRWQAEDSVGGRCGIGRSAPDLLCECGSLRKVAESSVERDALIVISRSRVRPSASALGFSVPQVTFDACQRATGKSPRHCVRTRRLARAAIIKSGGGRTGVWTRDCPGYVAGITPGRAM